MIIWVVIHGSCDCHHFTARYISWTLKRNNTKHSPQPGIEPGPSTRQAEILTTELSSNVPVSANNFVLPLNGVHFHVLFLLHRDLIEVHRTKLNMQLLRINLCLFICVATGLNEKLRPLCCVKFNVLQLLFYKLCCLKSTFCATAVKILTIWQ